MLAAKQFIPIDSVQDDLYRLNNLFESIDDFLSHESPLFGLLRASEVFGQCKEIVSRLSWLEKELLKERQEQLVVYNNKIESRAKLMQVIEY